MQFNLPTIILVFLAALFLLIIVFITYKSRITKKASKKNAGRIFGNILLIIGGLPLVIYPFVFLANLMQIAGFGAVKVEVDLLLICVLLFILASTSYPITYIACLVNFRKDTKKIILPLIPFLHLIITVFLGYLWIFLEKLD